jgi:hypothetical protein
VGLKDTEARNPRRVGRLERVKPIFPLSDTLEGLRRRNCESAVDKSKRGGARLGLYRGRGEYPGGDESPGEQRVLACP